MRIGQQANLHKADLRDAELGGVDLYGVDLSEELTFRTPSSTVPI
jgi:uncharacterized protein YjbI with pentapeptide repeats